MKKGNRKEERDREKEKQILKICEEREKDRTSKMRTLQHAFI